MVQALEVSKKDRILELLAAGRGVREVARTVGVTVFGTLSTTLIMTGKITISPTFSS